MPGSYALLFALATVVFGVNTGASAQDVLAFDLREGVSGLAALDPQVRVRAANELAYYGESRAVVPRLVTALGDEREPEVRSALIRALVARGDSRAVPGLVAELDDEDGEGEAVIRALGAFPTARSIEAITDHLRARPLSPAAMGSLARIGSPAVPALLRRLDEPPLRLSLLAALGQIRDPRAVPALIRMLESDEEPVVARALESLGEIGDQRAARAVGERVAHESTTLALAALVALRSVGYSTQADIAASRLDDESPEIGRAALRTLARLDLGLAVPVLERLVAAGDARLGRTAVEIALETPDARLASLLYGVVEEGSLAVEAIGGLAELPEGSGLPVLLALFDSGNHRDHVSRELAASLRRFRPHISGATLNAGHDRLRSLPANARSHFLRALAFDDSAAPELALGLMAEDPTLRATAADGLLVLGADGYVSAIAEACLQETDPMPLRRQLEAVRRLGGDLPFAFLWSKMSETEVAPEAMWMMATRVHSLPRRLNREARRAFRHAVRNADPRVRAGALRALSIARDRSAFRAALAALDDRDAAVRTAAAATLDVLHVPAARARLLALSRTESSEEIRTVIRDAARLRSRPRRSLTRSGDRVLRFRVVAASASDTGIPVDIVLPDGRWERMQTLASGELLVPDLSSGLADVRVRLEGER